jgi:hypothetical protein
MNRNDRKIQKIADERKLKYKDVPNKLYQVKNKAVRKRRLKLNPVGVTVLIRDNEAV